MRTTSLCALLFLAPLAAFAASQGEAADAAPDPVVVMTWENDDASLSILGPQPVIEFVEERLNIKFDWRLVPLTDLAQQLALIIAGGGDMPDLFTASPQGITALELAQKGIVIPFQEMIDAGKMPLVKAKLARPEYRGYLNEISHEGQIINLNTVTLKGPRQLKWVHYIRSDWYPELGIAEDPKTVDEFADFLRAVVSGDPNGNGKADEIGWTNFMSAGFPRMWLTSFGIDTFNHFPWTDINYGVENGSDVYFAPTSDRYKAMIDWIGKMFREGLFDPDIFYVDSPKFNTKAVENTVGAVNNWPVNGANLIGQLRQLDPDALYHILPDPTSSVWDGSDRVYSTWGTAFFTTYLAKAGKNIDAAVRAVDYMLGDTEFPITREMGIEGVHYEVADGLYKVIGTCEHCGNRPYAELASSERMTALGSPLGRLPAEGHSILDSQQIDTEPLYEDFRAFEKLVRDNGWGHDVHIVWSLSQADREVVSTAQKAFGDFVAEMTAKFITGQEPMSAWDDYVAQANRIAGAQIEAALAVNQAHFDRHVKDLY